MRSDSELELVLYKGPVPVPYLAINKTKSKKNQITVQIELIKPLKISNLIPNDSKKIFYKSR